MAKDEQTLTVGPVAAELLHARRAVERAKNHYFSAFLKMYGDNADGEAAADAELKRTGPTWDALTDLINEQITAAVDDWATQEPETNVIY